MSVPDALSLRQVQKRGLIGKFKNIRPLGRTLHFLRTGFTINHEILATGTAPPQLGEHTSEILEELGYSTDDIERFYDQNIV